MANSSENRARATHHSSENRHRNSTGHVQISQTPGSFLIDESNLESMSSNYSAKLDGWSEKVGDVAAMHGYMTTGCSSTRGSVRGGMTDTAQVSGADGGGDEIKT